MPTRVKFLFNLFKAILSNTLIITSNSLNLIKELFYTNFNIKEVKTQCGTFGFACNPESKNSYCIGVWNVCDGVYNCPDGSDERYCP